MAWADGGDLFLSRRAEYAASGDFLLGAMTGEWVGEGAFAVGGGVLCLTN